VGFGESPAGQQNEQGIYAGLKAPLTGYLSGSLFFDLFRHPERTFLVPFPTSGAECFLRLDYAPAPRVTFAFSAGQKQVGDVAADTDTYGRDHRYLVDRNSTTLRFDGAYGSPGSDLSCRARLELRRAAYNWKLPTQSGTLSFLELSYRISRRLSLGCRFSLFGNDGSDAALYEVEQELPGRLLSRQLNGNGSRLYLYGRWDLLHGVSLSAKYGETYHNDRQVAGAGGDQQDTDPLENNLSLQLDASF
jgi:hypothetical protein